MNPLLKKEIRLLLPAWGAALLLVLLAARIFGRLDQPRDVISNFTPVWLGVMMLCAASFGREFSLGTFSSLMAQPVRRETFWLTKVGVLVVALISVVLAYTSLTYAALPAVIGWTEVAWLGLLLFTAMAGGLWLALVVRQLAAVVWLVALVPGGLCAIFLLGLAHFSAADRTVEITIYGVLLCYASAGMIGSWRMLRRAQDAPGVEGAIHLPAWLSMGSLRLTAHDTRRYEPLRALLWKELHFNQVLLAGMAGLFLLQLAGVWLRFLYRASPDHVSDLLLGLGVIWVTVPLIIGCGNIAEERRLGMMESQLCLPASTRRQFLVKLLFVSAAGGGLSTALPLLAEWVARGLGIHDGLPSAAGLAGSVAGMTAIALIGFYSSSLTRNVHHAPILALGLILGIPALFIWLERISGFEGTYLIPGVILWNPLLVGLMLAITLTVTLPWLAYRNFRCLHESRRVWRRNLLGLAGAVAFTMLASLFLYHRMWEKLTPFEPAHGAARWTPNQRPVAVRTDLFNNLLIRLPAGQFWFGCLSVPAPQAENHLTAWVAHNLLAGTYRPTLELHQAIPGSNWLSVAAGHLDIWVEPRRSSQPAPRPPEERIVNSRETVAIRADGTLWVSAAPGTATSNTNPLVQFGSETNWLAVQGERSVTSVLLLKQDGTLWRWGDRPNPWWSTPSHWTGLRAVAPRQIGSDTNWQGLFSAGWAAAQKTDGSVWGVRFNPKDHESEVVLNTNFTATGLTRQRLDHTPLAGNPVTFGANIRPDGTLWLWGHLDPRWQNAGHEQLATLRSNAETNWVALALGQQTMVALKADGTLWRWGGRAGYYDFPQVFIQPPTRLGTHTDWVALTQTDDGFVTLAADGSLWFWRDLHAYSNLEWNLIQPSAKPVPLGNIVAANEP